MSNNDLNRRGFLRAAVGTGLILGLPGLSWAEEERARTEAYKQALKVMKTHRLDGVAVVIPRDAAGRRALATQLKALIEVMGPHGPMPRVAPYLLECVWVCVPAEQVGARPGETLVLLDPKGQRLAGARADLSKKAKALESIATLLQGANRGKARVKRSRANPEIARAVDELNQANWKHYQTLTRLFVPAAPAIAAAWRAEKDAKKKRMLGQLLSQAYWNRLQQARSFPYGVAWKIEMNVPAPCPPCGMARPTIAGRKFLEFFTN